MQMPARYVSQYIAVGRILLLTVGKLTFAYLIKIFVEVYFNDPTSWGLCGGKNLYVSCVRMTHPFQTNKPSTFPRGFSS